MAFVRGEALRRFARSSSPYPYLLRDGLSAKQPQGGGLCRGVHNFRWRAISKWGIFKAYREGLREHVRFCRGRGLRNLKGIPVPYKYNAQARSDGLEACSATAADSLVRRYEQNSPDSDTHTLSDEMG